MTINVDSGSLKTQLSRVSSVCKIYVMWHNSLLNNLFKVNTAIALLKILQKKLDERWDIQQIKYHLTEHGNQFNSVGKILRFFELSLSKKLSQIYKKKKIRFRSMNLLPVHSCLPHPCKPGPHFHG